MDFFECPLIISMVIKFQSYVKKLTKKHCRVFSAEFPIIHLAALASYPAFFIFFFSQKEKGKGSAKD
jgi:hypothetical protein